MSEGEERMGFKARALSIEFDCGAQVQVSRLQAYTKLLGIIINKKDLIYKII